MPDAPALVVFLGGMRGSAIEDQLGRALAEAALDLLDEALATGAFAEAVLVTDNAAAIADRLPAGVALDVDREPFHFGRRLAALVRERALVRPVYAGAGAVPLLRGSDIAAVAHHLAGADAVVISNNYFSADLVAFTPGDALERIKLPASDNFLPRLLHDQAGLESSPLPRSSATQFNIDSPADLAILKLTGGAGPGLTRFLDDFEADLEPYRRLLLSLVDPNAEVLLSGRVGSQVWSHLEKETACRLRVYSEERGMQAAGRDETGLARSLLSFHLREVGCRRFFEALAELGDIACIDTRPLLSHLGVQASRADRFWSDLGCPERIEDPFLRELTQAAREAPLPVTFGGHSLVAGGLMALTEAAWRDEDQRVLGQSAPS
ncbi:MAG: hypothetical protein WEE64_13575 [Dehalococcoidia bacterium]